ncbi:MAG: YciI family protein [Gemmatimonadaceae bacterium]
MLMDYVKETGWTELPQDKQVRWLGAYSADLEAMANAGVLQGTQRLMPTSTATTVRVVGGKTQVVDGPYADSKEQFAGFHIIDVPDLDAAIAWAARCPTSLHGVVEVRPIRVGSEDPVVQDFIDANKHRV